MVHIFLSYISEHGEKGGLMGKDLNSIVEYTINVNVFTWQWGETTLMTHSKTLDNI